jgi:predicted nucleic acid-binding Zn finger protein
MTRTQQVGKPERRGSGWFVPSASMPDYGYFVEIGAHTVRCTCPSFVHRRTRLPGGECKHIKAVRQEVTMRDAR